MGNKYSLRSGVITAKDVKVKGDLYVQDDIIFSDVSAGVLGVTGGIDMTGTTSAIGIDLSGGTYSTGAIRIGDDVKIIFGAGNDASFEYDENGTDNLRYDGMDMIFDTATKLLFRDSALSINSSADGQLDLAADTSIVGTTPTVTLQPAVAGTATLNLKADALAYLSIAQANGGAVTFTTVSDGTAGFIFDGGIVTLDNGATIDNTTSATTLTITETNISLVGAIKLDGTVTLDDDGTIADAANVMTITQDTVTVAAATAINLDGDTTITGAIVMDSAETTGLTISGATTTGIDVTGNATDAFKCETGTFTNGLNLGGTLTTGINIGACTTGISMAGAMTTGIDITNTGITTGIAIGSSGTPILNTVVTDKLQALYVSCDTTNGSTSYEPFLLSTTLTGAGQVGGRARFYMTSNVALGGWSNALKAEVTYGATGSTTGLGSAFVSEMTLSAGTTSGNYALYEGELNVATGDSLGTATSLSYLSVNGTGANAVFSAGANSYIFNLQGLTAGANNVFRTGLTAATVNAATTAALRIKVGATDYYIPLATSTA